MPRQQGEDLHFALLTPDSLSRVKSTNLAYFIEGSMNFCRKQIGMSRQAEA